MSPLSDGARSRTLLRLRPDLHWSKSQSPLGDYWRVRDPLSLDYHEFSADQQFLLGAFDGRSTLEDIKRSYEERFAPKRLRTEQLQGFAAEAHRRGLLLAGGSQQGSRMHELQVRQQTLASWTKLVSLLCIRLPGFDPHRLLGALAPLTNWLWSPLTLAGVMGAAIVAALMLLGQARDLATRLPTADVFLQGSNVALLVACFILVKAMHELAHGLACRHVGARCHEMGVMLIALLPCFYCDVTDVWMVPCRWKRMLVSAAGMYVELIVGVACSFLWMMSTDSVVSTLLLNVMVACTISTLLFNANPLLKLDGYFLLSDFSGVSNLHQRATHSLISPLTSWLGDRRPDAPHDWRLMSFAALSLLYRVFVVFLLTAAAHHMLTVNGLRPLGDLLVASCIAGVVYAGSLKLMPLIGSPVRRRAVRWGRVGLITCLAGLLIGGILLWPYSSSFRAPAIIEFRDAQPVSATVSGRLIEALPEGTRVEAGQQIARLENAAMARRGIQLRSKLASAQLLLTNLQRRATSEPMLLAQIPTAEASATRARSNLGQWERESQELILRSPRRGVLIGYQQHAGPPKNHQLPTWRGRLLDKHNLGAWVATGDVVAVVAPEPQSYKATLLIDSSNKVGLEPGTDARLLTFQAPGRIVSGAVVEVSRSEFQQLPGALRQHPELMLSAADAQEPQPLAPVILATVSLPAFDVPISHGSLALCRIDSATEPLGALLWRWLARTFPLRL